MRYNTDFIIHQVLTSFYNLDTDLLLENLRILSDESFFKEFGNIKIKLPRRSGHTTAAKWLSNHFINSLLIVPTYNMTRYIDSDKAIVASNIPSGYMDDKGNLDIVIVDAASLLDSAEMHELQTKFIAKAKLFVELG